MQDFIKAAKALSDETRLRIINILMARECCVCEVMQALDISQTRASRNLSILYEAGFLKLRKEGLWALYSIDSNAATGKKRKYLDLLLQAASGYLENNKAAGADIARLEKAERICPACG